MTEKLYRDDIIIDENDGTIVTDEAIEYSRERWSDYGKATFRVGIGYELVEVDNEEEAEYEYDDDYYAKSGKVFVYYYDNDYYTTFDTNFTEATKENLKEFVECGGAGEYCDSIALMAGALDCDWYDFIRKNGFEDACFEGYISKKEDIERIAKSEDNTKRFIYFPLRYGNEFVYVECDKPTRMKSFCDKFGLNYKKYGLTARELVNMFIDDELDRNYRSHEQFYYDIVTVNDVRKADREDFYQMGNRSDEDD